jgi:phage protein D/phage baseplate assembly protein gpV
VPAAAASPSRVRSEDMVAPITIKIGGQALDATTGNKLAEAVVKKVRVLPDMAHVLIVDPVQDLVEKPFAKLGAQLEILSGGPDDRAPKSMFTGEIASIEPEFRDEGVFVGFRAFDRSHAMTRSQHTRVFQDQTIGDIVSTVARPYFDGVSVQGATGGALPYMMQSNESDWDFVWRLANMIGFELVTVERRAKFRKVGEEDGEGPWLQYGQSEKGHRLFSFRPRVSKGNLPERILGRYVNEQGVVVEASASVTDGTVTSKGPHISLFGPVAGKGEYALPNVLAKDAAEMRTRVEAARDRILATALEADGVAEGDPDLRPGMLVEFRGLGKWNGKYLLSECVHVYRGGSGFRTRFHIAGRPKSLLSAVSPQDAQRAAPEYNAIVQGVVTNTNDPDKLGRVRVKLPTLAQGSEPEGWWARIATASAGKERGLLMLPQVGDKVMVGFENGDTRKPFILGSVWDGKAVPGKDLVQDDGSFSLKSDKKVLMKSKDNFEFETDKAWTGKAQKAVTFENSMEAFTIKSGKEIVLKAPTIKLEADMKVEIKGAQVAVNGNATLELKAPSITIGGGQVKLG